jgi:hypothetical protein
MARDLKDIQIDKGDVKGEFTTASSTQNYNQPIYYSIAIIIFLCGLISVMYFRTKKSLK